MIRTVGLIALSVVLVVICGVFILYKPYELVVVGQRAYKINQITGDMWFVNIKDASKVKDKPLEELPKEALRSIEAYAQFGKGENGYYLEISMYNGTPYELKELMVSVEVKHKSEPKKEDAPDEEGEDKEEPMEINRIYKTSPYKEIKPYSEGESIVSIDISRIPKPIDLSWGILEAKGYKGDD